MKPWEFHPTWHSYSTSQKWAMIKAYLDVNGGMLTTRDFVEHDYEIAGDLGAYGGSVRVCRHGTLCFPNLPCDKCWEES